MSNLSKYRVLTLFAGLVTALVIVFSQLFYFQAATYCQKKAESTQQEEKSTGNESHISIPSSSISSVHTIELNQELSFVIETLFEKEEDTDTYTIQPLLHSRLLQTLFRFIIAPNAP